MNNTKQRSAYKWPSARALVQKERASRRFSPEKNRPVLASKYLVHLDDLIKQTPHLSVILYVRVSSRTQDVTESRRIAIKRLRSELNRRGIRVKRVISEVCPGWHENRDRLRKVVAIAKKRNAVVLAESADRYLRSYDFENTQKSPVLPGSSEWEALFKITGATRLATLLHPDAHSSEIRSFQSKRGIAGRDSRGSKKASKEKLLPIVLRLHSKKNLSFRDIFRRTGVPYSTIRDWVTKSSSSVERFSR